jgi:hypothetical protein
MLPNLIRVASYKSTLLISQSTQPCLHYALIITSFVEPYSAIRALNLVETGTTTVPIKTGHFSSPFPVSVISASTLILSLTCSESDLESPLSNSYRKIAEERWLSISARRRHCLQDGMTYWWRASDFNFFMSRRPFLIYTSRWSFPASVDVAV